MDRACAAGPVGAEEIKAFIAYACDIGLVNEFNEKESIQSLCQRYAKLKRKMQSEQSGKRKSVTGGLRTTESYPRSMRDIVDLITIQKNVMPVGSFKYNVHKYPSDIDILEQVKVCCSVDDAKNRVAKSIQEVATRVRSAPDVYLGDFKAGRDERFELDLGQWTTDRSVMLPAQYQRRTFTNNDEAREQESVRVAQIVREWLEVFGLAPPLLMSKKSLSGNDTADNIGQGEEFLVGFDPARVEEEAKRLRRERLISFDELKRITALLAEMGTNPTKSQWEELSDIFRDHSVLRWNASEIAQGYKVLPGAEMLTLADAIAQKTLVKMDIWALVGGRYMEVTNFFLVSAINAAGGEIEMLTQSLPDYEKSIAKDVRFYSSPNHRKTLKALKRLWSLAIWKNNLALAERISPLFSSNAAALNQINGDAEVLSLMLKKLPDPPLDQIMAQIDGFKTRVDQLNEVTELNPQLFALINSITAPYYASDPKTYNGFEEAIANLESFQELINDAVEQMIYREASELGLENPATFLDGV